MNPPPHSRLASGLLAAGGFAIVFITILLIAGIASAIDDGGSGVYASVDAWMTATARVSLDDIAPWMAFGAALPIAFIFYRALRKSAALVNRIGILFGGFCLLAVVIDLAWWSRRLGEFRTAWERADFHFLSSFVPPLLGSTVLLAIGAVSLIASLHFNASTRLRRDPHSLSARAAFLTVVTQESPSLRLVLQVAIGFPMFLCCLIITVCGVSGDILQNAQRWRTGPHAVTLHPLESAATPTNDLRTLTVFLDEAGKVEVSGKRFALSELANFIREARATVGPDQVQLFVSVDSSVQLDRIIALLDEIHHAGVNDVTFYDLNGSTPDESLTLPAPPAP